MPDDGQRHTIPRTPSGWHNDAWKRLRATPKHDVMQRDVLTYLRGRKLVGLPDGAFVDRMIEGEYPIVLRGNIVAYVDAIEIFSVDLRRQVHAFEIKPVIETTFGIVRQIKHTMQLLRQVIPDAMHFGHLVVPAVDPLLSELRMEWPQTWAWGFGTDENADD
jgi:hypothetical protein